MTEPREIEESFPGETVEDALVGHEVEDRPNVDELVGDEVDDSDLWSAPIEDGGDAR